MKPNNINHKLNTPNVTNATSSQTGQQSYAPSGVNQQVGTHSVATGMRVAPQIADRNYTRLMRLLNNPNISSDIKEYIDVASNISNPAFQKKAWLAIAKCSQFTSRDRFSMVDGIQDLTQKISLLSKIIKGSLNIGTEERSKALESLRAILLNPLFKSEISPDLLNNLLNTINSALYTLATNQNIEDGPIALAAAMTIHENPELTNQALQHIVQNEHLDANIKNQALICMSSTCDDPHIQLKAYNLIKDHVQQRTLREKIIKGLFSKVSGVADQTPSIDIFKLLIQEVLPSATEEETKTIILEFAESMESIYSDCRAVGGDAPSELVRLQEIFDQLYEGISNHSLRIDMLLTCFQNASPTSDIFQMILQSAMRADRINNDDIYNIISFLAKNDPNCSMYCIEIVKYYLNLDNIAEDLKYKLIESIVDISFLNDESRIDILKEYPQNENINDLWFTLLASSSNNPERIYNEILEFYSRCSIVVSEELQYQLIELIASNQALSINLRKNIVEKYITDENAREDLFFIIENPDAHRTAKIKMPASEPLS